VSTKSPLLNVIATLLAVSREEDVLAMTKQYPDTMVKLCRHQQQRLTERATFQAVLRKGGSLPEAIITSYL
jgi:hypothetical protein